MTNHHHLPSPLCSPSEVSTGGSNIAGGADGEWRIKIVTPDEAGCRFYLEQYKPFRLAALRWDPEAFGSTHAREIAFSDQDWLRRIRHPLASVFVVVKADGQSDGGGAHSSDDTIMAAASLIGPLPPHAGPNERASLIVQGQSGPRTSRPRGLPPHRDDGAEHETEEGQNDPTIIPSMYEIAGVYTRPADRGRGLGGALMRAAVARAVAMSVEQRTDGEAGNRCLRRKTAAVEIKTVVYVSNKSAVAFYEKCGFAARGPPRLRVNPLKGPVPVAELDMFIRPELG